MTRLDDDLGDWAATVRLSDSEAAGIFQEIVRAPAPSARLDPRWWREFNADFAARMVSSTRRSRLVA